MGNLIFGQTPSKLFWSINRDGTLGSSWWWFFIFFAWQFVCKEGISWENRFPIMKALPFNSQCVGGSCSDSSKPTYTYTKALRAVTLQQLFSISSMAHWWVTNNAMGLWGEGDHGPVGDANFPSATRCALSSIEDWWCVCLDNCTLWWKKLKTTALQPPSARNKIQPATSSGTKTYVLFIQDMSSFF